MSGVAKCKSIRSAMVFATVACVFVVVGALRSGGEEAGAMALAGVVGLVYAGIVLRVLPNIVREVEASGMRVTSSRVRSWALALLVSAILVMFGVYALSNFARDGGHEGLAKEPITEVHGKKAPSVEPVSSLVAYSVDR